MNHLQGPASSNPIARVLTAVVAALALVASLFVGAVVFLIVLGVLAVMMVVFAVRFWRIRRQFRAAIDEARARAAAAQAAGQDPFRQPSDAGTREQREPRGQSARGTVIDGEYRREES